MLLAEGSKHCCQGAWANAAAAEPWLGFSCVAAFATEQPLVSLWGSCRAPKLAAGPACQQGRVPWPYFVPQCQLTEENSEGQLLPCCSQNAVLSSVGAEHQGSLELHD